MTGIYKFQNKLNNKVYIGQSINVSDRYTYHMKQSKGNAKNKLVLHKALLKYGIDNFDFEVLCICPKEDLNIQEKYWIKYWESYTKGYNQNEGGTGGNTFKYHSDAKKQEIRTKLSGRTPWNKDAIGVMPEPWNKGKTDIYSEATIEKIKLARSKQVFTEETRKKKSDNMKNGFVYNRIILNSEQIEFIKTILHKGRKTIGKEFNEKFNTSYSDGVFGKYKNLLKQQYGDN